MAGSRAFINSLLFINIADTFQSELPARPQAELEGREGNIPIIPENYHLVTSQLPSLLTFEDILAWHLTSAVPAAALE